VYARPDEIERMAERLAELGYGFEVFPSLTRARISCKHIDDDTTVAEEDCPNAPNDFLRAVDGVVSLAYLRVVSS